MAKKDFCFTYYDADAARDMAHMNRLERGAYGDIISAQRKRGHLSRDDIKKVLSGDFEACWPSLEWILETDETGKFFIEWVDKSIEDRKTHSKIQKERIDKYWERKRTELNQSSTKHIPRNKVGISVDIPFEDENEDVYGNVNKERGVGETVNWEGEQNKFLNDGPWQFKFCTEKSITVDKFDILAKEFLSDVDLKEDYKTVKELRNHFTNWYNLKHKINGNGKVNRGNFASGNGQKPTAQDFAPGSRGNL